MSDLEQTIRAIVRDELAKALKASPAAPAQVTVRRYAELRSISRSTVRAAIREGRLPAVRIGRAVRIPANAEISRPVTPHARNEERIRDRVARLVNRGLKPRKAG